MLAEEAIMAMTTEAFWEQAAQDNGITDIGSIGEAHRRTVQDLNAELFTANFVVWVIASKNPSRK
jgi:hypothetical protein